MLTYKYNCIPVTRFASQTEGKFGQLFQQSFKTRPYPNMLTPTTDSKNFFIAANISFKFRYKKKTECINNNGIHF